MSQTGCVFCRHGPLDFQTCPNLQLKILNYAIQKIPWEVILHVHVRTGTIQCINHLNVHIECYIGIIKQSNGMTYS